MLPLPVRAVMRLPGPGAVLVALCLAASLSVSAAVSPAVAQSADASTDPATDPLPGQLREEILAYDVTIDVQSDGWLEITEEIRVRALGDQIRRGIYRDFPTTFPREAGVGRIIAPFEVTRVLRDGQPEPYQLQSVGGVARRGGVRVLIGDADTFLEPGEHTYVLSYRTLRWIRFGETRDELYWNVTGNGWDFPIASATATVRLPAAVPAEGVTLEGWTGPEGSTASALTSSFGAGADTAGGAGDTARFRTTAPLGPREGLTIRVRFPKGLVAPPTDEQVAEWFLLDWRGWIEAGIVVGLVLLGYLLLWVRVGRDPPGRPVPVRYEPPEGFTPAGLGFVMERGHAGRQLTASVVDLAVRGWLTIDREEKAWTLTRTDAVPEETPPPEEAELLTSLFGGGGTRGLARATTFGTTGDGAVLGRPGRSVKLKGSSDPKVRKAAVAFRKKLARGLEGVYFVLNRKWFVTGLLLSVLGFAFLAWRDRFAVQPEAWFLGVWLTLWTLGTGTLVIRVVQSWRSALSGSVTAWMGAGFISLFSVPFVGAHVFVSFLVWRAVPGNLFAAALALGAVNVLFYHLLERPTLQGRRVMDAARGFEQFLTSTEENRIRHLQPGDAPLQLFERFLPWAIALGVESEWAEQFEDALARESAEATRVRAGYGAGATSPSSGLGWYSGAATGSLAGLTGALGSSFSSALSSSSAPPSSSGGSSGGGGGSSGGGGGGGGGGGW